MVWWWYAFFKLSEDAFTEWLWKSCCNICSSQCFKGVGWNPGLIEDNVSFAVDFHGVRISPWDVLLSDFLHTCSMCVGASYIYLFYCQNQTLVHLALKNPCNVTEENKLYSTLLQVSSAKLQLLTLESLLLLIVSVDVWFRQDKVWLCDIRMCVQWWQLEG